MAGRDGTDLTSLRLLFHGGAVAGLTDGQLLERFVTQTGENAETAFAALVERHGAMVRNTCHAVLRDEHAAQDAFQATFFVLARRARSLWVRDSLGPWLHRVARRAANRVQATKVRRTTAERKVAEQARGYSESNIDRLDLGRFLHEEIDRLPERHRVPVVLCDLEGRTYEDAARHLGCPVGTVKSRLARGRERLRERLVRRGVAAPAGLVAAALIAPEARAALAAPLVNPTVRAALQFATRRAADTATSSAPGIADGVIRSMFLHKLKVGATPVLALAFGAGLAGAFIAAPPARTAARPPLVPSRPATPPRRPTPAPLPEIGIPALAASAEWLITDVDAAARTISVDTRAAPGGTNTFTFVTPRNRSAKSPGPSPSAVAPAGLSLRGLKIDETTKVTIGSQVVDLNAFHKGMRAWIRLRSERSGVLESINGIDVSSQPPPSTYTLVRVDLTRRTISVVDERRGIAVDDLPVAADVPIQLLTNPDGLRLQNLEFEDLETGLNLALELAPGESGSLVVKGITAGR